MPQQSVAEPPVETTAPPQSKPTALKRLSQMVITYVWFIGALSASAGRLNSTRGWVSVVLSDDARRWYDSEESRELKQMRLAATISNAVFMAGV